MSNISHSYGKQTALDCFSATLPRGEITALLGPNGAGKSTLFKLISGLLKRQHGSFSLDGQSIDTRTPHIFRNIGFVFQEPSLDPGRTGLSNLRYAAGLHGFAGQQASKRIEAVCNLLQCHSVLNRPIRTLSGGEKRRIEIARALLHRPTWLLLDEPRVGLDIDSRAQLSGDLHRLSQQSELGILWCTHITDELEANDQLVIIANGRNCFSGKCGSQEELLLKYREVVDQHG